MIEAAVSLLIPLISFVVCIITASYLGKTSYFSFLNSRVNRFGSVDGARGFLALAVFFHHFVITYYWKIEGTWKRPPDDLYQNFGKVGVVIFFMITGFLFFSKILNKNKSVNWIQLYKSRVFRIVPLYLFSLVIITLIVFVNTNYQVNVSEIRLLKEFIGWGVFFGGTINGFLETKLINSGVDWTLRYEWLFYLSLPLCAFLIKKLNNFGMYFLFLGSIFLFINPIANAHFSTAYIIYFCIGGGAYFIAERLKSATRNREKIVSAINLILMVLVLFYPRTLDFIHVAIIALLFLLIVSGNDIFGLLSLRSSIVLGEISYSIYLLHGIILYVIFSMFKPISFSDYSISEFILFMPLVAVLVVLISAITYLFIEKTFIRLGKAFSFNTEKAIIPVKKS
tara:strand:+ start:7391 stop:8578 length:1188 start_codon:yes stop_codon:yes gene_type:complete